MPNTPKLPPDVERRFDEWRQSGQSYMNPQDFVDGWHQGRLKQFIAQELDNLKAQVRKEIEEQITKMENSNWLHGMGLSGSQAEYIEANIKASYRSIPSLEE